MISQILNGLRAIKEKPTKVLVIICYEILLKLLFDSYSNTDVVVLYKLHQLLGILAYLGLAIVGAIMLVIFLGMPFDFILMRKRLSKIELKNRLGEIPQLIGYKKSNKKSTMLVYDFYTRGIPLSDWERKKDYIETALGIVVIDMYYIKGNQLLRIECVKSKNSIPSSITWKDTFLQFDDFQLNCGIGLGGRPVIVDLSNQNSMLIAGSTGSGKSVLLKNILYQCSKKGAEVYVADFKGGVDFVKPFWHEHVIFMSTEEEVIIFLDAVIGEMERRKQLFLANEVSNIKQFNEEIGWLPHIVFACDEVAELLDKSGLSKEKKAVIQEIEGKLSTIARLGRAFGIHLILATQRPDANILSGQIKNNVDIRVCGRADAVLSQIILDNTSAKDEIRKNQQGRFIMSDGTVFQGYWQEEI